MTSVWIGHSTWRGQSPARTSPSKPTRMIRSAVTSSNPNVAAFIHTPRPSGSRADTCPQMKSSWPLAPRMRQPRATSSRSSSMVSGSVMDIPPKRFRVSDLRTSGSGLPAEDDIRGGWEHMFDVVRRTPLPLCLLVPRRGLAARRDRPRRARAGIRGGCPDRSQLGLGIDGVRGVRARTWVASDPRCRGRPCRRSSSDTARGERRRLVESLPHPDSRARAHARKGNPARPPPPPAPPAHPRPDHPPIASVRRADRHPEPRKGTDLPERLRVAGGARRVHAQAPARCVRTRSSPGRAAAPVPARRSRPQPAPRASRGSDRRAVRGHGKRPCAHARSSPASGRARGHSPAHHARCLRARAAR